MFSFADQLLTSAFITGKQPSTSVNVYVNEHGCVPTKLFTKSGDWLGLAHRPVFVLPLC